MLQIFALIGSNQHVNRHGNVNINNTAPINLHLTSICMMIGNLIVNIFQNLSWYIMSPNFRHCITCLFQTYHVKACFNYACLLPVRPKHK